jgi:hypothetical protein
MPRHEEGADDVCAMLADAKSRVEGKRWTAKPAEHVADDGCLRCDPEVMPVQVTRVGPAERWAEAGRTGIASGTLTTKEAADEIWQAIERKLERLGRQATRAILAVSVRQPGMHGFAQIVEEFRRIHGAKLQTQVAFTEVWLVGYGAEMTYRVHP